MDMPIIKEDGCVYIAFGSGDISVQDFRYKTEETNYSIGFKQQAPRPIGTSNKDMNGVEIIPSDFYDVIFDFGNKKSLQVVIDKLNKIKESF